MVSEPVPRPSDLSGPRRRPRERKRHIILAARDLFVEHGFANVSMGQIAEKVGVTAGALYRHVKTKADLLSLVFEDSFTWLDEPPPPLSLSHTIDQALGRVADNPYLTVLWVREARFLGDEARAELRHRMRTYSRRFAEMLGERRPDFDESQRDLLGWAVQSLISSVGSRTIKTWPPTRLPTVRQAIDAVLAVDLSPSARETVAHETLQPSSRRERLLQAAFVEFARVGYHESSMTAIAAVAGVTGPNVYGYYASKADLLRAVYDRSFHGLWLGLNEALSKAEDFADALTLLIEDYVQLSRRWPRTLEETSGIAEIDEFALVAQREYVSEWVTLLRLSRPKLDASEARLRVQVALVLISDLHRIPHLSNSEGYARDVANLVRAVLLN